MSAVYLKLGEIKARAAFEKHGKDFDDQPVEVRFTLTRYAMNRGGGGVRGRISELAGGADIPRSGATRRNAEHPYRTAVLHAARAIHLSQKVFGLSGTYLQRGIH